MVLSHHKQAKRDFMALLTTMTPICPETPIECRCFHTKLVWKNVNDYFNYLVPNDELLKIRPFIYYIFI